MDSSKWKRTFRIANYQTITRLSDRLCTMPLVLNEGWNIIQIDLNSYSEKAFRTKFVEVVDLQVNASARLRTIYFSDRIYKDEELKDEYKIFVKKQNKTKYIPSLQLKQRKNKTKIKQVDKTEGEESLKREDVETEAGKVETGEMNENASKKKEKENEGRGGGGEGVEEIMEDASEEKETEEGADETELLNMSSLKNVEMNMENVIYEDVNYENYNNDDN